MQAGVRVVFQADPATAFTQFTAGTIFTSGKSTKLIRPAVVVLVAILLAVVVVLPTSVTTVELTWEEVIVLAVMSAATIRLEVTAWVEPAKGAIPTPGDAAVTKLDGLTLNCVKVTASVPTVFTVEV